MTIWLYRLPKGDLIGQQRPATTRRDLQKKYRKVHGPAALQYFLDLAVVDPDSFCRFYVLMTWRMPLQPIMPVEEAEIRRRMHLVKQDYAKHLEKMQHILMMAANGPENIVAFLREQADIEYSGARQRKPIHRFRY